MDIQGHRGCRGLLPENTIPAFLKAIELGVNTLECDVVVSKDEKVILSHEPFFSHHIATGPNGEVITKENEINHNVYALTYDEIKSYDVGLKHYPRFDKQEKIAIHKPSLEDVVRAVDEVDDKMLFNIEIKRRPEWDKTHHPVYTQFADIVINRIKDLGILDRTTVQCFDIPTLQYIRKTYADVPLVYLIDNLFSPSENIERLGFIPEIYSPNFLLVNPTTIDYCKANKMRLIPWTVNELVIMERLIELKVDGIITDYPDILIDLVRKS